MSGRIRLPWWPLALAIFMVVVSCALCFIVFPKLNTDLMLPEAIVGYVLTPFGATGALVLARAKDLKLQGNPDYLRLSGQKMVKTVGYVVAVSFIPAFLFIWYIASYMGSKWS